MDWAELLRWLHLIGAAVLLGTGAGIAFPAPKLDNRVHAGQPWTR